MTAATSGASTGREPRDPEYVALLEAIKAAAELHGGKPLVRTDAEGLWDLFIQHLPPEMRQHHQCRACRPPPTGFVQPCPTATGLSRSRSGEDGDPYITVELHR